MRIRHTPAFGRQAGLSLIELMVAILLSSLLLLGVVQIFSNSQASSRTNTEMARLQESSRVALEILKRDFRRLGYQGCASPSDVSITNSFRMFPRDAITSQASDCSQSATLTCEAANTGSDRVEIVYASPVNGRATSISSSSITFTSTNGNLRVNNGNGQEFLITDCERVATFTGNIAAPTDLGANASPRWRYTISSISGATVNGNAGPAPSFNGIAEGARVHPILTASYSIRSDNTNNNRSTLYKNNDALIADVDNFQILYGINTGNQIRWINASSLTDALRAQVSQLQISLVMSSPDTPSITSSTASYPIANLGTNLTWTPPTSDQNRLRRAYNAIIDVRNR
ncbi:PilW family protein [Pseudomonas taiwanensis]|uniref:PilW family protein n=1 Tax=Pseudomonas taiwanensis TaxID=470150 RepID=UPI0015BBF4E2|nr:PilW family protein [Pseudomonas taiwanensis]